jgi:hypothetical protein
MIHSPVQPIFAAMVLIAMSTVTVSCVTAPPKPVREPVKIAKSSVPPPAMKAPPVKPAYRMLPKALSADAEYNAFFSRMAIPENEYTERDRQTFASFPPTPSGGTIHEAALVVGLLRDVLTPVGTDSASFKTADTAPSAAINTTNPTAVVVPTEPTAEQSRILEVRARAKGVDIISALASNPYLKSYGIFNLASDASHIEGNSQAFVQNLASVIKSEVLLWADMLRRLGLDGQAVAAAPTVATTFAATLPPTETVPPAKIEGAAKVSPDVAAPTNIGPLSPAENAAAAKLLATARELALKDSFEKAIIEARKVTAGADSYADSQENIKNWANRAVQELRRQAANQYQASRGTNDVAGKKLNLNKSKSYLEEAITKYPEASTLDTVKENLAIIDGELARLM